MRICCDIGPGPLPLPLGAGSLLLFTPGCVLWLAYPGNCDGPPGVCMAMPERDLAKGVTPVLGSTDRCFSRRFNGKLLMPDVSPVSSKTVGGGTASPRI